MGVILTKDDIIFEQRKLKFYGFDCGLIDGIWGKKTEAAKNDFESFSEDLYSTFSHHYFDLRTKNNIIQLHPYLQSKAWCLAENATSISNFTIKVLSGVRTYEEQEVLYNKGRTTPGEIVTNSKPGGSYHNYGLAFDVGIFSEDDYLKSSDKYIEFAPKLKLGISNLEWGGDWKGTFKDYPHYQIKIGRTLASLKKMFESGIFWSGPKNG
jgi:peptidoglycan LD-endopeptidase CwlK